VVGALPGAVADSGKECSRYRLAVATGTGEAESTALPKPASIPVPCASRVSRLGGAQGSAAEAGERINQEDDAASASAIYHIG